MNKAWKVFGIINGHLTSYVVRGKALKKYRKGVRNFPPRWLKRKGYGITVFRTRKEAYDFCMSGRYIKPVKYGKVIDIPTRAVIDDLAKGKIRSSGYKHWPFGTLFVDWVRLI